MSAIALKWVSEIKTGSPSAKHLLLFMASHNFDGNKNFFSIRTLCEQLELSERTIQTALNLLIEQSLIIKEQRYREDGGQTTNCYIINIPETYSEDYFKTHITPPAKNVSPPLQQLIPPPRSSCTHNNNINNNINKRESTGAQKRALLSDDYSPSDDLKDLFIETAQRCGIKKIDLFDKFMAVNKSSGKKSADWDAELKLFLLREKPLSKKPGNTSQSEVRSTVKEYGPGHPTWESFHGNPNH